MSTFLSWTSPSCIEKSRVPFPSFCYREKEYDFAQLAVLHMRKARRTNRRMRTLRRQGRCRGMISLSNRVPGERGLTGSPRRRRSTRAETPPTEPTGEGAGGRPNAKSRIR